MKNLAIIIALSIAFSLQSCAQNKKDNSAPEKVKTAFNEKFPDAKKV
ncbi:MAG: hypothetical protein RLP12_11535 [Ekhidna sp.]